MINVYKSGNIIASFRPSIVTGVELSESQEKLTVVIHLVSTNNFYRVFPNITKEDFDKILFEFNLTREFNLIQLRKSENNGKKDNFNYVE